VPVVAPSCGDLGTTGASDGVCYASITTPAGGLLMLHPSGKGVDLAGALQTDCSEMSGGAGAATLAGPRVLAPDEERARAGLACDPDPTQCWIAVRYHLPDGSILEGWVNVATTLPLSANNGDPTLCGEAQKDATGQPLVYVVGCTNAMCSDCSYTGNGIVRPPCSVCYECVQGRCTPSPTSTTCGNGLVCNGKGECGIDPGILGKPCLEPYSSQGHCRLLSDCTAKPGMKTMSGYCPGPSDVQCCVKASFPAGVACAAERGLAGKCELMLNPAAPSCSKAGYEVLHGLCPLGNDYKCCVPTGTKPGKSRCVRNSDCAYCQKCKRQGAKGVCVTDTNRNGAHCDASNPVFVCSGGSKSACQAPPCPDGGGPVGYIYAADGCRSLIKAGMSEGELLVNGILDMAAPFDASVERKPGSIDLKHWVLLNYVLGTLPFMEYLRDYRSSALQYPKPRVFDVFVRKLGVNFIYDFHSTTTQTDVKKYSVYPFYTTETRVGPWADVKGAVLSTPTDIFVEFRGSEGLTTNDYFGMNMRVFTVAFEPFGQRDRVSGTLPRVHAGQYYGVLSAMASEIFGLIANAARGTREPKRVWFLGHSLGGANALMAAAIFQERLKQSRYCETGKQNPGCQVVGLNLHIHGVVTFGAYMIGDALFSRATTRTPWGWGPRPCAGSSGGYTRGTRIATSFHASLAAKFVATRTLAIAGTLMAAPETSSFTEKSTTRHLWGPHRLMCHGQTPAMAPASPS
jgi:pimeloyl-ACP methyl ester carboxylesterase